MFEYGLAVSLDNQLCTFLFYFMVVKSFFYSGFLHPPKSAQKRQNRYGVATGSGFAEKDYLR